MKRIFFGALITFAFLSFALILIFEDELARRKTFRVKSFLSPMKNGRDALNNAKDSGHRQLKPFIYLTEAEEYLPPNLASPSQIGSASTCNCDIIVLSFKAACKENTTAPHISYLLGLETTWASGRNVLFFTALDRKPGYHYYIFLDEDVRLDFNKFTPPAMAASLEPFRAVETWLLDHEPAIGVLDYSWHDGAQVYFNRRKALCGRNQTSLVVPVVMFDALFNAFHYKAVTHLLPYREEYDNQSWSVAHQHIVVGAEIKFRGQVLMFTAVKAGNPRHRSYPKNPRMIIPTWKEFAKDLQRLAPRKYRNHSLFKELSSDPNNYVKHTSKTVCMNVTKHQAIVPYAHMLGSKNLEVLMN